MNNQQHPQAPRTLNLCTDDFGLSPGIAQGIAQLAQAGRISAVSCITNVSGWSRDALLLPAFPRTVGMGLHLNLTEGVPLSTQLARVWPRLPSLPRLLVQTHLRLAPRQALQREIAAQWHAFVAATGRAPDFVDGHQHVHHLPVVRDALMAVLDTLPVRPAVRSTARVLGRAHAFKRWLIAATGGRALGRQLVRRALPHNGALLGVYDFHNTDYRALMQSWLGDLPPQGGLVFCHPGALSGLDAHDAIAAARGRELAYLSSDAFVQDLANAHVVLENSWWRTAAPVSAADVSEMSRTG
ncbi:MAG: ChbG/HpnK family deacetylase [Burkholderiaceae bacterium]